jgi:manganese transport protein
MLLSVLLVGAAFAYQVALAKPDWALVVQGILSPQLHKNSILIAASMLGATVMPHVVFLHSALMNTEEKFDDPEKRYKIAIADNFLALNFAWLINSAMVITFAAAYAHANNVDPTIESATKMLPPMLGGSAGFAFGWALIIAGLSSTTVGSMAGQVILDGFFKVRIPIWFRRLLTLLPCIVILHMGIDSTRLLVWSQAALSVALPFTIIPLIWLNSSTVVMGTRRLKGPLLLGSVVATGLVVGLNACLLITTLRSL